MSRLNGKEEMRPNVDACRPMRTENSTNQLIGTAYLITPTHNYRHSTVKVKRYSAAVALAAQATLEPAIQTALWARRTPNNLSLNYIGSPLSLIHI